MEVLILLIPISLGLVALALWALFWAIRTGQFDDLDGPAYRVLYDEPDDRPAREGPEPAVDPDQASTGART